MSADLTSRLTPPTYLPLAPLADTLVTLLPTRLAQLHELEHEQEELQRVCAQLEAEIARVAPRERQRWTGASPPPPLPTRMPSDITKRPEDQARQTIRESYAKSRSRPEDKENAKTLRRLVRNASSFSLRHRRAASEITSSKKSMSLRSYWSSLNFKNTSIQENAAKRRSRAGLETGLSPSESAPWRLDDVVESSSKGKRKSGFVRGSSSLPKRAKVDE